LEEIHLGGLSTLHYVAYKTMVCCILLFQQCVGFVRLGAAFTSDIPGLSILLVANASEMGYALRLTQSLAIFMGLVNNATQVDSDNFDTLTPSRFNDPSTPITIHRRRPSPYSSSFFYLISSCYFTQSSPSVLPCLRLSLYC